MRSLITDLSPGTSYYIQARTVSDGDSSQWSPRVQVTTQVDAVAPSAPTSPLVTMSAGTAVLTWGHVTTNEDGSICNDLATYRITVKSASSASKFVKDVGLSNLFEFSFDQNRKTFGGAVKGDLFFDVQAVDTVGNVSSSATSSTLTVTPPPPPANLYAVGTTSGVILNWDKVVYPSLAGYRIYTGSAETFPLNTPVFEGSTTSYLDNTSMYGVDHYYKVVSVDIFGNISAPTSAGPVRPASPFTVDSEAPSTPTSLGVTLTNAADANSASAVVTWTAPSNPANDLSEYIIGYKPSSETEWQYTTVNRELTSTRIDNLLPFRNYDFKILAKDWTANSSNWSAVLTKTAVANTAPSTVTGLTMTAGKDSITASWTANTETDVANGAGTYTVEFSPSATFATGVLSYRTGATSHTVAGVSENTTYYVRAKAVDSLGLSSAAWSTTANAKTGVSIKQGDIDSAVAGKSTVLYQSNEPAASYKNATTLWIDTTGGSNTPKRWNTTSNAWDVVTDKVAVDAANAVNTLNNTTLPAMNTKIDASIKSSVNEYAVSASETVAPTSGWSTSTPTRTPGTFVWFRTAITYTNNSTTTTNPALLTGNTGSAGTSGAPAPVVSLTATTQVLTQPATGGATTPNTSVVTGVAANTTITVWEYSVNGAAFSATVPAGVSRSGNAVTITGSTMTARTLTVRMADANGIADTMTVAKVVDGAAGAAGTNGTNGTNGSDGAAGADAYTLILTNEAQVFAGSTNAALAGSATSSVIALKGSTAMPATIGTITGQVTGLTTAITNNGTTNATVTVTVTTSLTAQSGVLTIPITVDGKSFTKTFAWSVSRQGAQGSTGGTGVGITSITPYFIQVSTGAATPATPTASPPPSPWTATEPTYVDNTELYRTERILYTNSTFAYTSVSKVSAYTAANIALTAANGKNKSIYSLGDPNVTTGFVEGDVWRKVTTLGAAGEIQGEWVFTSGAWQSKAYSGLVLTDLDAAKITFGTMSGQRIATNSLVISQVQSLQTTLDAKETPANAQTKANNAQSAAIAAANLITNKVNNPTKSGTTVGWSTAGYLSIENQDFFGTSVRTMKSASQASTTHATDYFDVDVNKAYEIKMWFKDPTRASGNSTQFYVGLTTLNQDGTNVGSLPVSQTTGATGANTTNFYFWYKNAVTPDWTELTFYVFPHAATASDMFGIGTNPPGGSINALNAKFNPDATRMQLRFLNWSNTTAAPARELWVSHVTVQELSLADVQAKSLTNKWAATGTTEIDGGVIKTDTVLAGAIKAGSTFTQNLTVGSQFTLGNATTNGTIISYNYTDGGTSGFKLSKTGLVIKGDGNSVSASAFSAGDVTAAQINLKAGGSLVIDAAGGELRSSNWSTKSTGFKMNTTLGLEVNDGDINAKVLRTNTAFATDLIVGSSTSAGSVRSFNYNQANRTGYKLTPTSLELYDGTIEAKALNLQWGQNMYHPAWSDFEWDYRTYSNTHVSNMTAALNSNTVKFGRTSLGLTFGSTGSWTWFAGQNELPGRVDPSKKIIVSFYMNQPDNFAVQTMFGAEREDGTVGVYYGTARTYGTGWVRVSDIFTFGSTTSPWTGRFRIGIRSSTTSGLGKTVYIDGVQAEEQAGSSTDPSSWSPPSTTSIDGGAIKTGTIYSDSTAPNNTSEPAWSINTQGAARFARALIVDELIVGDPGNTSNYSYIKSTNYSRAKTGWIIDSNGRFEANEGVFRGRLGVGVLQSNLVSDPSFESEAPIEGAFTSNAIDKWTYWGNNGGTWNWSKSSVGARSGRWCARGSIPSTNSAQLHSPLFPVTPGKTYEISFSFARENIAGGITFDMKLYTNNSEYKTTDPVYGGTHVTPEANSIKQSYKGENKVIGTSSSGSAGSVNPPKVADVSTITESDFVTISATYVVPPSKNFGHLKFEMIGTTAGAATTYLLLDDISVIEVGAGGTEITSAGIRLFDEYGQEAGAFVHNRPNYLTVGTQASIDAKGAAKFASLEAPDLMLPDGPLQGRTQSDYSDSMSITTMDNFPEPSVLDRSPRGYVGRVVLPAGTYPYKGSYSTTGGVRHGNILLWPGRTYKVTLGGSSVTNDHASSNDVSAGPIVHISFPTTGWSISTDENGEKVWNVADAPKAPDALASSSFFIDGRTFYPGNNSSVNNSPSVSKVFSIAPDGQSGTRGATAGYAGVLIGVTSGLSTNNFRVRDDIDVIFEDIGPAIDEQPSTDVSAGATPNRKTTKTIVFGAKNVGNWSSSSQWINNSQACQGYFTEGGSRSSAFYFNNQTTWPSSLTNAADIQKIEVYVYCTYAYGGSSTASIMLHSQTSRTTQTKPAWKQATSARTATFEVNQGKWLTIPKSLHSLFVGTSPVRGFGLEAPSSAGTSLAYSSKYDGSFGGAADRRVAKMRVTYLG